MMKKNNSLLEAKCKAYLLLCKIGQIKSYSPKEVAEKLGISEHLAWRKVRQLREVDFVKVTSRNEKAITAFEGQVNQADQIEYAKNMIARYSLLKSKQGKLIMASIGTESLRMVEIQERTGLLQPNIAAFLAKAVKSGLVLAYKPEKHTLYTLITTNELNHK